MKKDVNLYLSDLNEDISVNDLYCGEKELYITIGSTKIYKKECSSFVHRSGSLMAHVVVADEKDTYIIYTDNIFSELPIDYQQAFVEHEIGHIISGYFSRLISRIKDAYKEGGERYAKEVMVERQSEEETIADKYAAKKVGLETMIGALRYFVENYDVAKDSSDEIMMRIKELESMG